MHTPESWCKQEAGVQIVLCFPMNEGWGPLAADAVPQTALAAPGTATPEASWSLWSWREEQNQRTPEATRKAALSTMLHPNSLLPLWKSGLHWAPELDTTPSTGVRANTGRSAAQLWDHPQITCTTSFSTPKPWRSVRHSVQTKGDFPWGRWYSNPTMHLSTDATAKHQQDWGPSRSPRAQERGGSEAPFHPDWGAYQSFSSLAYF